MFDRASRMPPSPAALPALQLWVTLLCPLHVALFLNIAAITLCALRYRLTYTALLLIVGLLALHLNIEQFERRAGHRASYAYNAPIGRPIDRQIQGPLIDLASRTADGEVALPLRAPNGELHCTVKTSSDAERARLRQIRVGEWVTIWARLQLSPQGERPSCNVKSSRLVQPIGSDAAGSSLDRIRSIARERISANWGDDDPAGQFYAAILIGVRDGSSDWAEALSSVGLAHLIAISGLHVGLVGLLLLSLLMRTVRAPWMGALLVLICLALFVPIVGSSTPVLRAASCAALLLIGRTIGREGESMNRLAVAATLILIAHPDQAASISFLLSFVAVASILLAQTRPRLLSVSLGATIGTAPLTAHTFGSVTPLAPIANIVALPLLPLLLLSGYAGILLPQGGGAQQLCVALSSSLFELLIRWAALLDRLPLSPIHTAEPNLVLITLFYLSWFLRHLIGRSRRTLSVVAAVSLWLILRGPVPAAADRPSALLIDVGQGQSLLWSSNRQRVILDAGGRGWGRWDPGAQVVVPAVASKGWRRIDRLILSHGDADHAAGATAVLERLQVEELWLPPHWWHDTRLSELAAIGRERGGSIRLVAAGSGVPGVQILAPAENSPKISPNAGSLVALLGQAPHRLLVPGDLDGQPLRRWIEQGNVPRAEALVLPHHGSRHGVSPPLLNAVGPHLVLVSCGFRNRFGHPAPGWSRLLASRSIPLVRTDHYGSIPLTPTQSGWTVPQR